MRNFLLYIFILAFPFVIIMCSINIFITPNYIYNCNYIDRIIHMAGKGYNATNVESKLDERIFKKKYAELFKNQKVDYLILGASRHMLISSEAVYGEKTLNLAISGAMIEDLIAIYQICNDNNIIADNIILGIDPQFFNSSYRENWWKAISEYYYEFLKISNNSNYNKIEERLFSIEYFRMAINAIKEQKEYYKEPKFLKTFINDGFTRRTDGSIYYPKEFREKTQESVDLIAKDIDIREYEFDSLSTERITLFERLLDSIQSKGTKIQFACCPYHPILFQRINKRKCIRNTSQYIKETSSNRNISIIGDYNPESVGFSIKDFYDATHARKESLDNLIQNSY